MTAIATDLNRNNNVKWLIESLVSPSLKQDQAFLNMVPAIHTVAYMKGAINSLSRYKKYRHVDTCERLIHEEPRIAEKHLIRYFAIGCNGIKNNSKRTAMSH